MFFLYFSSVAYINASVPPPQGGVTRRNRVGGSPLHSVASPPESLRSTPAPSQRSSPGPQEPFSPDGSESPLANQTKTVTDQLAAASEAARLYWEGKIKEMAAQHKAALKASQDALAEKNMAIETYKEQLMAAHGNLDKKGEEFRTKIDALTKEILEKSAALIAAQTKVGNDKQVAAQLAAAHAKIEELRLDWERKIKGMVAQHEVALKASQDALAEKNRAIETYKNQLMVAQGNLDKKGEEFRTKIDALTKEIQEKSTALTAAQTNAGADKQVANQLAVAQAKIEAQRKEIAQKEVDLESVRDTLAAEKRAVEDYENKLKEVIKGDTTRAQKEKELQTRIDVLNKTLKEKDAALIAAQTNAGADKQLAAAHAKIVDQLAATHAKIEDQKKELDRLARALAQREGEIPKLQASLTEEQKKVGDANQVSSQLAAAQERIQKLEEQKQRDAAESKATVERLEAVLKKKEAQLQEEGTTLKGALKLIQEKLESANSELNQKKQELNELQMHVDSLEERVALQTVPEDQLKQELNDKIAAVRHLMEQLNDLWDRQSKSPVPAFVTDLSPQTLNSRAASFNNGQPNRGNSSSPSPQHKGVVSPVKDQITALQRIIDDQQRIITDQKGAIAIFNGFWDQIAQQNPDTARNSESTRSARTAQSDRESELLGEVHKIGKERDQLLARYTNLEHDYGRLLKERKELLDRIRELEQQLAPKTKPKGGFCC